jgi:hypothetical protein
MVLEGKKQLRSIFYDWERRTPRAQKTNAMTETKRYGVDMFEGHEGRPEILYPPNVDDLTERRRTLRKTQKQREQEYLERELLEQELERDLMSANFRTPRLSESQQDENDKWLFDYATNVKREMR